jgi:hypothetical protein
MYLLLTEETERPFLISLLLCSEKMLLSEMRQNLEIAPNLPPKKSGLKVRTRGSQPRMCVPTFSLTT